MTAGAGAFPPFPALRDALEPEAWALFCGLSSTADADRRAVLDGLDREGWRRVAELSLRTFSAPLLWARLRERGTTGALPAEVRQRLEGVYTWNLARNLALMHQRDTLGRALATAGVRTLVLKGAHVVSLYAQPGARAIGDIDILVAPTELQRAQDSLLRLGYGPADRPPVTVAAGDHRHLPAFRQPGRVPVELHWTLADGAREAPWEAEVWARAEPLGAALGMAPADALVFAAEHLALHHHFGTVNGLAGLADVALLAERHAFDPDDLARRAERWGCRAALFLCLLLARELLGAPIPGRLLSALVLPGWEIAATSAAWTLFHVGELGIARELSLPTRATLVPPPPASGFNGRDRVGAALRYAARAALPPADALALEFRRLRHRPLRWLAWPAHWSRLAWGHAGLVRLLRPSVRRAVRRRFLEQQRRIADFVSPPGVAGPGVVATEGDAGGS